MPRIPNHQQPLDSRRNFLKATGLLSATALAGVTLANSASAAQPVAAVDVSKLERVKQTLVAPPFLPEHEQVATGDPKIFEVTLNIEEKKVQIDQDGTEIWAFTYHGWVPGPMIVVHEGDYVEPTLKNPSTNVLEHNIDFHSSTGALGGGARLPG